MPDVEGYNEGNKPGKENECYYDWVCIFELVNSN